MNDSGWSSKEFDDLLEQAATVNDYERYQLLGKAEDLLLSSGMVLPIYRTVTVNIINTEEVGGWASNAFDIHPLKYLYKRQVKSKLPNVVFQAASAGLQPRNSVRSSEVSNSSVTVF